MVLFIECTKQAKVISPAMSGERLPLADSDQKVPKKCLWGAGHICPLIPGPMAQLCSDCEKSTSYTLRISGTVYTFMILQYRSFFFKFYIKYIRVVAYRGGNERMNESTFFLINFKCMVFKNLLLRNNKEFLSFIMGFRRVGCSLFASGLFRKQSLVTNNLGN